MKHRFITAAVSVLLLGGLATGVAMASEQSELLAARGLVDFHAGRYAAALPLFDQAVAADPKDAAALYYRGVTQGHLDHYAAAIADLQAALALKPDFDQVKLELGVATVQSGAYKNAVPWLQQAQAVSRLDAEASLFLGQAQLELGQFDAARQSFARAASRDAHLTVSSRYYEGVAAYQAQNWAEARQHFDYVASTSPDSEMGREAAKYLIRIREGRPAALRSYQLYGSAGFQYDSNVQLAPSNEAIAAQEGISKKEDERFIVTVGGAYAPWQTEHAQFSVGYEFFQSAHFSLHEYNLQDHRGSAQIAATFGPAQIGLTGRYDYYFLETTPFLQEGNATPWVSVVDAAGNTEVFFRVRRRDFFKGPYQGSLKNFEPSGVLDSFNYSVGVRRVLYLTSPDYYLSASYRYDNENPINAEGNQFGYDGNEVGGGAGCLLPWGITTEAVYLYHHESYYAASHGRADNIQQVIFGASRNLTDYLVVTLGYFYNQNDSSNRVFEYDRHIVSLSVGVRY